MKSDSKIQQDVLHELRWDHTAVINGGPCVSMYVPARRMGANATIGITRLKNLMRTARSKVVEETSGADGSTCPPHSAGRSGPSRSSRFFTPCVSAT